VLYQSMALTLTLIAILDLVIAPEILGLILESYHLLDLAWFLTMMIHKARMH
jgi:hypothetical protein